MTDVIKDPKMKSFIESTVSNDFGLSVDEVAEQCKSYGRFSAWLNSNVTLIKEVLNAVKDVGVSPAFFASYERTEGYNASWGWLNHTTQQGSYLNDARVTAEWIVSQSKNTTDNPAWIDYANYNDFVPNNVKQAGNTHFSTLPSGTIGKVVIAGTAAATWEVYYPNGLLAEYNGVQNYGTPINHMIQYIEEWGGSISSGSGGNTIPDGYQLAKFPMDNIDISQGEFGDYTHTVPRGEQLAIDFMARDKDNNWLHEYPYYAPFDSEVIDIYNEWAQVIWRSTTKVFGVDGTKHDVVTYSTVHDWNYAQWSIGDKVKQGDLIGHTGDNGGGGGGGDHLHLQAFNTNYHPYPATTEQQIHLYNLMDTSNVKIWFRDGGYPWKVWEGGNNTPDPDPDPDPDPPDPEPEPPKIDWDKLFNNIDDKLEDMLKTDVYKVGNSEYFKNNFLILTKQMDNTYKIKPNIKIFETVHDTINDFIKDIKDLL